MFKLPTGYQLKKNKNCPVYSLLWICLCFIVQSSPAVAQSADSAFIHMNSSYQYEAAGNYSKAISTIIHSEFPPEFNYQKMMRLGWLNYQNYNSAGAIVFYKEAEKLEPGSLEAKEALLKNHFVLREFSDAERTARKILKISTENYQAHYHLAQLAFLNLNYPEAEFHLKKIIRLFPTDFAANNLLFQCYLSMKNKKKAAKVESLLMRFYPEIHVKN